MKLNKIVIGIILTTTLVGVALIGDLPSTTALNIIAKTTDLPYEH
ncbi:hypothetical protein ACQKL5_18265 [Peribacillus sp. NPDC097675]